MKGTIFNIQKFCINDGPGIRTSVFLKGCPLNCIWCHNPESKSTKPELFYDERKCILCGQCAAVCPNGCHTFEDGVHRFDRKKCVSCGACAEKCMPASLERVGYETTVEEVMKEVMKDEIFYRNSGGGMTVTGGEPMAQFEFTYALLQEARANGLHTCIETCGFARTENYEKLAELVDIFLFDYKETVPEKHREFTGADNELILKNLFRLDELGAKTILRCPIIPTRNNREDHFEGIADVANRLKNILEINIEPYHPLGSSKSTMLGREYELGDLTFPDNSTVEEWIAGIGEKTSVLVKKA